MLYNYSPVSREKLLNVRQLGRLVSLFDDPASGLVEEFNGVLLAVTIESLTVQLRVRSRKLQW